MEEEIGQNVISRCYRGEKPLSIYAALNRSKIWFFKWLKRYQSGNPEWFKDKSTALTRRLTQISEVDSRRIISVWQHLESQRFAQTGASGIKFELTKSGYRLPSNSTINRVLKREGLIKKTYMSRRGANIHISLKRLI